MKLFLFILLVSMRLVRASSVHHESGLELVWFSHGQIPDYAILSHTWGKDEVALDDIRAGRAADKASFQKVRYTCEQALRDGFEYVWIDSCCIDRDKSAELAEAINSMFTWYENAGICYAYLADVPDSESESEPAVEFASSRWFMRGWTLQELLAPADVQFFSCGWRRIGDRTSLGRSLREITNIDEAVLACARSLASVSIAKRMSWAARRQTTVPEDIAYCLMGVFQVSISMMYGEGRERAFRRLQEEIMTQSDDLSLFAWRDPSAPPDAYHGLLAPSPRHFGHSHDILHHQTWESRQPSFRTNRGLHVELPLTPHSDGIYVAALDCSSSGCNAGDSFLGVYLQAIALGSAQFARVRVGDWAAVSQRGKRQMINVRQNFAGMITEAEGLYPTHTLQMRSGPAPRDYKVVRSIVSPEQRQEGQPEVVAIGRTSATSWIPQKNQTAFKHHRSPGQLSGAVLLESRSRSRKTSRLLVMLGSAEGPGIGVHVLELPPFPRNPAEEASELDFGQLQDNFSPVPSGQLLTLEHHRVQVDSEVAVIGGTKYFFADLHVEPTRRPGVFDRVVGCAKRLLSRPRCMTRIGSTEHKPDGGDQLGHKAEKSSVWQRDIGAAKRYLAARWPTRERVASNSQRTTGSL